MRPVPGRVVCHHGIERVKHVVSTRCPHVLRTELRGAAGTPAGVVGVTGSKVCGCDEGGMEGLVLTAYLDASSPLVMGNVQILFEGGFFVADPPDEAKLAVDEMTEICSGILAGRIGPAVQAIATGTGMVPGSKVEIFSLEFRYLDNHGQCDWKVRPVVNPKLIMIKDGLVTQVADECAEQCAPVIAGRFTDCAMVRSWTVR
jgi:hypothetical protein